MLHNDDILISNDKLHIIKKENYFLCESRLGKSVKFGNFTDKTYIYEKNENNIKTYEWEEKSTLYFDSKFFSGKNYRKYKFSFNSINSRIAFSEEMVSSEMGGFCSIFKTTYLNSDLSINVVKILDTPIDTNYKYSVFATETYKCVMHQDSESILKITTINLNDGKISYYKISAVKEWDIITKRIEENKIYYPFISIQYMDGHITICSLDSFKCLKGNFKNITPVSFIFSKEYYSYKNSVFFDTYCCSICIDDNVYDSNFNILKYKKQDTIEDWEIVDAMKKGNFLDNCGQYIAYEGHGIHILKVDYVHKIYYPVKYVCEEINNNLFLKVKEPTIFNSQYISFDVKGKKFVINKELIKNEARCHSNSIFEEHYGLMDALDGDPEAYWNID